MGIIAIENLMRRGTTRYRYRTYYKASELNRSYSPDSSNSEDLN